MEFLRIANFLDSIMTDRLLSENSKDVTHSHAFSSLKWIVILQAQSIRHHMFSLHELFILGTSVSLTQLHSAFREPSWHYLFPAGISSAPFLMTPASAPV